MQHDKPTAQTTDPAVIAKRLTPNQRKALLWLPDDGGERQQDKTPHLGTGLFGIEAKVIGQDIEAHLAAHRSEMRMVNGSWVPSYWRATKLGLQVRKVLCNGG